MKGARNTVYVVSLALLASLVGHFAIHRYFERRMIAGQGASLSQNERIPFSDIESVAEVIGRLAPLESAGPRHLDRDFHIIPAQDIQEDIVRGQLRTRTTVPTPADAAMIESPSEAPASDEDENTAQVREVIERELASASVEERDIWFEELKSLPAGVVADLLQVRRQLHGLPKLLGGVPDRLVSTDSAAFPRTRETAAEPVSQRIRFNLSDQHFATEAIETVAAQLRHNLVNSMTPGFKRLRVTLVDVYSKNSIDEVNVDENGLAVLDLLGEGCRVGPILLEMRQGPLKKTSRSLDLAIEGRGFFVVQRDGKQYLTRCGVLTLDRDRHLCLAVSSTNAILQPALKIPEAATEIQVSDEGVITARPSDAAGLTTVGRLTLADVACPDRLQPVGNLLLLPNENSGDVVAGEATLDGRGSIRQGFLEQSNVDLEQELAEIEELSLILKAIPQQATRPATARSLNLTPAR